MHGNPPTQERIRQIFWELGSRYPIPKKGGDWIVLASVSARLAYLNWSISEHTVELLRQQLGSAFGGARRVVRVFGVTDLLLNGVSDQAYLDILAHSLEGTYYLHVPKLERELYLEFGFVLRDGSFHALARSNTRYFDRDYPAKTQDPNAAYVGKAFRPSFEVTSLREAPALEKSSTELGKLYGSDTLSVLMVDACLDAQVDQLLARLCDGLEKLQVNARRVAAPGPMPSVRTLFQVVRDRTDRLFESVAAKHEQAPIDLLHCYDWSAIAVGVRALEELGIPFILTMRSAERERAGGNPTSQLSRTIYDIEAEGAPKAGLIIAPQMSTQQDVSTSYGISRDRLLRIDGLFDLVQAEHGSFNRVVLEHFLAYRRMLERLKEGESSGMQAMKQSIIRTTSPNRSRSRCRGLPRG